ncbi:MAG: DUF4249 family protein [Sphingomonadales bacterium]
MKKRLLHTAISVILSACVKEIPYNPEMNSGPVPAVHCFITPDSILTADCRLTAPFGSKDMPLKAAKFTLFSGGQKRDSTDYTGNGVHRFRSNSLKAGDSFVFSGRVSGMKPFDIRGKVPNAISIDAFDTSRMLVPGTGRAFSINMRFNDPAAFENHYRCYLYKTSFKYIYDYTGILTDSFLKSELISLFSDDPVAIQNNYNNYSSREVIFSDATFNGVNKQMVFYTSDPLLKTARERPVGVSFHLENISKSLFNFYNTRNAHIWQQQSISQLPGRITGNIPGGYGVAGAYTRDFRSVALKR